MSKPILTCVNLSKTFTEGQVNIEVLKNINFSINTSELVAIVGNSGSGKSTLLHLLGGLDKPTMGHVTLNGENLSTLSEVKKCELRNRYLGFVYQFHHLLPEFSALENTGMPLLIKGEKPHIIEEKAKHLLALVGLEKRFTHRLGQLSGGERQRVAIARALITDPLCVLADEPTGNLDPTNAARVLELFFDLQVKCNTSVIMVTHDREMANRAGRILAIELGELRSIK